MRIILITALAALATVCGGLTGPHHLLTSREIVKSFDTVHPQVIKKTRHSRNVHPDGLDVKITSDSGETFTLQLTLNNELIAPHFSSVFFSEDGKEIKLTDQVNCFYHGQVLEHPEWKVAMDSCQGLRGTFGDWSNKTNNYNIEPLTQGNNSLEQPHALYQTVDTEEVGECGTKHKHTNEDSANVLDLDEDVLERARRQSPTGFYIIELYVVSDTAQHRFYSNNVTRTVNRAIALVNYADRIYRSLNIRIVLVHADTWTSGDRILFNSSPETTLQNFRNYIRGVQTSVTRDANILLTGNDFNGNTVGIAYVDTMCGSASVGVVQDRHLSTASTASTFAHEMGHILSMEHDTASCSCTASSRQCVMAAISYGAPELWSSCSVNQLQIALGRTSNNLGRCLGNEPTSTVTSPVCGNGIREGDEICDCGSEQECNDPCCNARTCRLATGAECTKGDCCTSTCRFKTAGTSCRSSQGQCDIQESCTGQSAECPADVYLQDGSPCNNNQAYCFSGECKTYDAQCQKHFRTNKGVNECFSSFNTRGDYYGNCGSNGNSFIPCTTSNVMCGQLFCQDGTFQNTVSSVYVLRVGVYVSGTQSVQQCVAFTPPATSDIVSPGLVEDGIKCASGKMCYEQRCVSVSSLGFPQCPTGSNGQVCSGNGKCNNKGTCSCNSGYTGRTCDSTASRPVNECLTNNGGCHHICVDTTSSYLCRCRGGYQLTSNRRTCTDINECSTGTHNCAQRCHNTAGSYTCSCNSGYQLASDGRSCNPLPTTSCGGRLVATSGSFQTPGWPRSYPQENFQCEWIVDIPLSGYAIQFTIDRSAYGINGRPPCSNDYIQFFDGIGSNDRSLHKLCRYDYPGAIRTSSAEARVVFSSSVDSNRPAGRVGVRVSYTIVDIDECATGTHDCQQLCQNIVGSYTCSCNSGYTLASDRRSCIADTVVQCGGRLTASSGSFQSPGYPNGYPQEEFECEWIIDVSGRGSRIEFTVDNSPFGINDRPPCTKFNDHIEFFDGTGSNANSLRKLCGKAKFYSNFDSLRRITTTSSQAKVVFTGSVNSNRPASRVGVRVTYRVM